MGARPAAERRFAVYGDPARDPAPTLVRVEPDGEIRPAATPPSATSIALDGITFRVAAELGL